MRRLTGLVLGAVGICSLIRGLVRWLLLAQLRRDQVKAEALISAAVLRATRIVYGRDDDLVRISPDE